MAPKGTELAEALRRIRDADQRAEYHARRALEWTERARRWKRDGIKWRWLKAVKGQKGWTPNLPLVAKHLAAFANDRGGDCHPGFERLAEKVGCSESTIKRHTATMERYGMFYRERRLKKGYKGQGCRGTP